MFAEYMALEESDGVNATTEALLFPTMKTRC